MGKIVSEWLEGPMIELNAIQCLNHQSSQVFCYTCINSCPTEALQLGSNNGIELNNELCLSCGKCVSACPVLAVDYLSKSYTKTTNQMTAFPNCSITCDQFDQFQKGIKVPCYFYFDTAMLTHYVTVSKELPKDNAGNFIVELYIGKCEQCRYNEHISVQEHLHQLQNWFDRVGLPIKLIGSMNEKRYLLREDENAADGITRRTLLKSLAFSFFKHKKEQEEDSKDIATDELDPKKKTTYKRQLIHQGLTLFREQIENNNKELPVQYFAMVTTEEPCTKCTICEKICPTEALVWTDTEESSTLHFYPHQCIACRRCEVCPMNSISVNPIKASEYINNIKIQLSTLQIGICKDCGDNYRKLDESQKLCPICNKKEETIRTLFESF